MFSTDTGPSNFERELARRFERSRFVLATWLALPALCFVVISAAFAGLSIAVYLGLGLYALSVFAIWRGGTAAKSAFHGLVAGSVPFALAFVSQALGHVCVGSGCYSWCMAACAVGGLIAGGAVSCIAVRTRTGKTGWLVASSVVFVCGFIGCQCVGISNLVGLGAGQLLSTLPWARSLLKGPSL